MGKAGLMREGEGVSTEGEGRRVSNSKDAENHQITLSAIYLKLRVSLCADI